MKTTKIEKVAMLTMSFYLLSTCKTYAAIDGIGMAYTMYIRPILVSLVVLTFIVTGLLNIKEFRKGGDAQKEVFIHCIMMAVYPGAILALAEAVKAIMAMFTTSL
ncbi:MAG: hypothetical protein AB9846_18025 [Tenuifilaceae bacterium]